MKQVLISIQPKWVNKIASGEKTIEVRKTRPKIETPFKCYIYETTAKYKTRLLGLNCTCQGKGKVIGEFVCDRVDERWFYISTDGVPITDIEKDFEALCCLKRKEIINYALQPNKAVKVHNGTMFIYGWHISDLKIYDKPKDLSEFKKENKCYIQGDLDNLGCWEKGCVHQELGWCDGKYSTITKPPQSWCYVESGVQCE